MDPIVSPKINRTYIGTSLIDVDDLILLEEKYKAAIGALEKITYHQYYPVYPSEIESFMGMLIQEPWGDYQYQPNQVPEILKAIEQAGFEEIRWVLTAANRSERFCDGAWKDLLEKRQLDSVIERIKVLFSPVVNSDVDPQ